MWGNKLKSCERLFPHSCVLCLYRKDSQLGTGIPGLPRASFSVICSNFMWSLQNGFWVADLLHSSSGFPVSVTRERARWKPHHLFLCSLTRLATLSPPHFIGQHSFEGPLKFKEKKHRPYFSTEVRKYRVSLSMPLCWNSIWEILMQSSLENIMSQ